MTLLPDRDGVFRERRTVRVDAPVDVTWSCIADLGGAPGWYAANRLWALRGRVDRLLGGPGLRSRPDRALRTGDAVDGWRVHDIRHGRSLTLRSEQRMPGRAFLTHEAVAAPDGPTSVLEQRLEWHPDGWRGRLMWWLELPAHVLVMRAMVRGMGAAAERRAARPDLANLLS
ncbi:DUF2867 domain-containing protein [Ornithinimicrobium cerasi]|uniref:Polyketide cyclase / dehydrase and lipid transport n=1 Tax=Ornithinimicrobium cerasi TaxID=2248773 RepID=A0A285VXS5_9MICO|nr:DUF2867 domain-containing protein [Ornithinimicrobium cerasi]SOC58398.1 Protein of unknown function [Ornithinimicrobium cerasi]